MRAYDTFMQPLERLVLEKLRKPLMEHARGSVLEIGFGTGINMQHYNFDQIDALHALDVKDNMRQFDNVTYHILSAETLPFEDESFDTVVMTLTLCTIKDPQAALLEIKRVLKASGQYIFIEHEQAQQPLLKKVFNAINPLWRTLTNGCNINRETHKLIEKLGFKVTTQHKGVFHYGIAMKTST
jgi:ubiquinone/menaquinone biosynthesis C-methylase UbiE